MSRIISAFCWIGSSYLAFACGRTADPPELPDEFPPPTPAALQPARDAYELACRTCHGRYALGTDRGPPLVHRVYRPSHHADAAFSLAVRRGVRAHHWTYGDMPPVPGVTDDQVVAIVGYVRWLQEIAGID